MGIFIIRVLIFFILGALLAQVPYWEASYASRGALFSELSLTELTQTTMLLSAGLLVVYKAATDVDSRQLAVCMALVFLVLLIRENDQTIEMVAPHGSWKYIALFPVLFCLFYFFKHRVLVAEQLTRFTRLPSSGILLSGLSVLMFSRLFGRTTFWNAVMGDKFVRSAKKAAEESVELMALGLILAAMVEFALFARPRR